MPANTSNGILDGMITGGVLAVIRLQNGNGVLPMADALLAGGLNAMEITFTTPGVLDIIRNLASEREGVFLVGAGTVTTAAQAEEAIQAGAEFVVSPVARKEIIEVAHRHGKVAVIGAFSPTEILDVWEAGADLVKVFPATKLGPQFFKDVHGPLPQVRLTPTGGVNLQNAADFIRAGAECIGVGTALLDRQLITAGNWKGLTDRARQFHEAILQARSTQGN